MYYNPRNIINYNKKLNESKNRKYLKIIFKFLFLILLIFYLNKCLDPRKRFEGYRDCHIYNEVIENKMYLEKFRVCNFWVLDSDIYCYYLTDSINFRIYLGHNTESGNFYIRHDSTKIIVEITHPKAVNIDTKDTYYFKDLINFNNIEKD